MYLKKNDKLTSAVLTGAVVFGVCSVSNALVIDEFNGFAEITAPPKRVATVSGVTDLIGGERDLQIEEISSDFGNLVTLRTDSGGSGVLTYNEGSGEDGLGVVTWDGDDSDPANPEDVGGESFSPTGLGGIDLTEGGINDGIGLDLLSADIQTDLTITLYTDANNFSSLMIAIPGAVPPAITLNFPFASFTDGAGASGPAVLTNIGAIQLTIDITEVKDNDVTIDRIVTTRLVPVPAAIWAAAPVLAGLGIARKRLSN